MILFWRMFLMDDYSQPIRTVKTRRGWDWHLLIAFFFIGTGVGIPIGVAMLCWRAWCEYKNYNWREPIQNMGDLSADTARRNQ